MHASSQADGTQSGASETEGARSAGTAGAREAAADDSSQGRDTRGESNVPARGVLDELTSALAFGRTAVSSLADLIVLEARDASLALMWMLACGIVAGVCIVAAWIGLMVVLALAAIAAGAPPIIAAIGTVVLNLVGGAALIGISIGKSRALLFPVTRRQLSGAKRPLPGTT